MYNPVLMIARGMVSPRIPETFSFWLLPPRSGATESEAIEEQAFHVGLIGPMLSKALDRRVPNKFFQNAAQAIASKGFSIALPLSTAGLLDIEFIGELLEHSQYSPLPPRLLHLIAPISVIKTDLIQAISTLHRLCQYGCRIVSSQIDRNLGLFDNLKYRIVDYLLLDSELNANTLGNLIDEMWVLVIQDHAQRLDIKTIAGPVQLLPTVGTLSSISINMIYGDIIANAQPLDLLLSTSDFAIS